MGGLKKAKKKKTKSKVKRVHCSKCGRISPKTATTFDKRMGWLRRHRKRKHPTAHKESVKKTQRTKVLAVKEGKGYHCAAVVPQDKAVSFMEKIRRNMI